MCTDLRISGKRIVIIMTGHENDALLKAEVEDKSVSLSSLPTPTATAIVTAETIAFPSTATTIEENTATSWKKALDHCIAAIVNIRIMNVRAFESSGASSSYASGFVVSKEKGIILTNRHVLSCAPVVADAITHNKEEIDLLPLYRDPLHDFAFCKFNPDDIKYMELTEIELDPDGATIGREIRVVGNDSGEKIQILPGILARVDRDAPYYGSGYNDWNTFYYSAASSTSGGSSGSPVLTIDGKAIALNAGAATKAASSFYLPLHRIKRALDLLLKDQPVPRGTLQTIFKHKAFDEVRRLGLTPEAESKVRMLFPAETGMLVVEQVIPKGPGHGELEPGDVLLEVNGEMCTTFIPLEDCLDSHVGGEVRLKVQRGGVDHSLRLQVQDLHSIIPSQFLTVSAAVLHPLSYHLAKAHNMEVSGVFLSSAGYMLARAGINIHCIIVSLAGKPTPDLDSFQSILESFPDGARTSVQFVGLADRHRLRNAIIQIDRQWFPMGRYIRQDPKPTWRFVPAKDPPQGPETTLAVAPPCKRQKSEETSVALDHPQPQEPCLQEAPSTVSDALVLVSFDIPYLLDGIAASSYVGAGIIFDKENGYVLVDRMTAPIALGDALVNISGIIEVLGQCIFIHPIHNFAVVRYDPREVEALAGQNVPHIREADFSQVLLTPGDVTTFHGLVSPFVRSSQRATVTKIDTLKLSDGRPPQYVGCNTSVVHFDQTLPANTNGFFEGSDGKVVAVRLCYAYQYDGNVRQVYRSVPSEIVLETVKMLKGGHVDNIPTSIQALPLKFSQVPLAQARAGLGLSDARFQALREKIHRTRDEAALLLVRRVAVGSSLDHLVKTGDVILACNGELVLRSFEVESLVQAACSRENNNNNTMKEPPPTSVVLDILRDHQEISVEVQTTALDTRGTNRFVMWAGLMLQEPHLAVKFMGYVAGGVYISRWCYGSPAQKYGLRATTFIEEINSIKTPDLDSFLAAVNSLSDQSFIRIKGKDLDGKARSYTLKPHYEYWPTTEHFYSTEDRKWHRKEYFPGIPSSA